MGCTLSIYDALGTPQFSQDFSTPDGAIDFIEDAITPLLENGAKYIVVAEQSARVEKTYRARTIADCIFARVDWSRTLHRCLYLRPYA